MATVDIKKKGTGFILTYGDVVLALDTAMKGASTLLSHSHSDHTGNIGNAEHIVATKGTLDTLSARGGRIKAQKTIVKLGDTFGQIGVNITLLNAGHVLGSTMFLMEFDDDLRVLYTGDFNTVDSMVHHAATAVKADVLITEATYGKPEWIFPNREQVYDRVLEQARKTVDQGRIALFRAYSLGKAQEAIALLQQSKCEVLSGNRTIDNVSQVYNNHGKDLQYLQIGVDDVSDALTEGCVIVSASPKHTFEAIRRVAEFRKIEPMIDVYNLSGWTLNQIGGNGFPLSAHTDFQGLIQFAKEVNPRITYCFTSNGRVLSSYLNDSGIQAVPLE